MSENLTLDDLHRARTYASRPDLVRPADACEWIVALVDHAEHLTAERDAAQASEQLALEAAATAQAEAEIAFGAAGQLIGAEAARRASAKDVA